MFCVCAFVLLHMYTSVFVCACVCCSIHIPDGILIGTLEVGVVETVIGGMA